MDKPTEQNSAIIDDQAVDTWIKPEVTSFAPVKAAEGAFYQPGDGVSNLTP